MTSNGRGRPPKGLGHIDDLEGDAAQKRRLKAVLESLEGQHSLEELAEEAGVSLAQFHALRKQALQAALDSLAPKPAGRPPNAQNPHDARLKVLEDKLSQMEFAIRVAEIRNRLARIMREPMVALGFLDGHDRPESESDDESEADGTGDPTEGQPEKGGSEGRQQRRGRQREEARRRRAREPAGDT